MQTQILKNPFVRSPTLDTVIMVERLIEEHSGGFNRTELWKSLPKQVMWQTYYVVILDYLETISEAPIARLARFAASCGASDDCSNALGFLVHRYFS